MNASTNTTTRDIDLQWAEFFGDHYYDPLGFVDAFFPWGEEGTALEHFDGPREWQRQFLIDWGKEIVARDFDGLTPVLPIEMSTASGHGIGKSALTAFCVLFLMFTRPRCQGVITATSAAQLKTKTWAEIGKWLAMAPTAHWFKYSNSAQSMSLVRHDDNKWRCDAVTCAKENSEAFAGLHANTSSAFYIFDEASGVPDEIWEVSDGGLTDGEPHRLTFGNPTRNSGRFYRRHHQDRKGVVCYSIDSREVEGTNKEYLETLVQRFGENSDYAKVRVRGMFPDASDRQFIAGGLVEEAMSREDITDYSASVVVGVDVARFGSDESVILTRMGRDARSWPVQRFGRIDTMALVGHVVAHVAQLERRRRPYDAIMIDATGVGGGVVDRLKELGYKRVYGIEAGGSAINAEEYANRSAEMLGGLKEWLADGGRLPQCDELRAQLTAREYHFKARTTGAVLQLESKDDLKKRGEPSPDIADALALTFAMPVASKQLDENGLVKRRSRKQERYNPYRRNRTG